MKLVYFDHEDTLFETRITFTGEQNVHHIGDWWNVIVPRRVIGSLFRFTIRTKLMREAGWMKFSESENGILHIEIKDDWRAMGAWKALATLNVCELETKIAPKGEVWKYAEVVNGKHWLWNGVCDWINFFLQLRKEQQHIMWD